MTEAEWLACVHPEPMLEWLRGRASGRKVRLFACACARRICGVVNRPGKFDFGSWVVLSEDLADDRAITSEVEAVRANDWGVGSDDADARAFYAVQATIAVDPFTAALGAARYGAEGFGIVFQIGQQSEFVTQAAILGDIFGNPFRPVVFSPSWRTDTAVALAKQMYESREFSAMPILADALQDAGCDNEGVLNHCRDAFATHVRGCWVVDLVLGKE